MIMEQTIDIRKMNEDLIALKLEVAKIREDLGFARDTEEAWEEIDEGKGITMSKEEFLKEIDRW